ncbi:hypothetical protein B0H14DRAFT_3434445 [Mycena olivaceomarginata]|nr:hypothetical protein B0H14DRAFT_3434445 [Mycena olivaceomarginata]
MSGSGITYYNEELKMLLRLLKVLPDTIPEGDLHDFRHYVLDPIKMKDIGCAKTVLSAKLKSSFGYRGGPRGEEIITSPEDYYPRPAKITDAKRRLKGEAVEEQADKRRKKEEKAEKAAKKDQVAVAKPHAFYSPDCQGRCFGYRQ